MLTGEIDERGQTLINFWISNMETMDQKSCTASPREAGEGEWRQQVQTSSIAIETTVDNR